MSEFRPFAEVLRDNSKEQKVSSEFQRISITDDSGSIGPAISAGNPMKKSETAFQPFVLTDASAQEQAEAAETIDIQQPNVDDLNNTIADLQSQLADAKTNIDTLEAKVKELESEKQQDLLVHQGMVRAIEQANQDLRIEFREHIPELLKLVVQTVMGSTPMMDQVLTSKINALHKDLGEFQWVVRVHPDQQHVVEKEYVAYLEAEFSSHQEGINSWKVVPDEQLSIGEIIFQSNEIEWQFLHKEILNELEDDWTRWLAND